MKSITARCKRLCGQVFLGREQNRFLLPGRESESITHIPSVSKSFFFIHFNLCERELKVSKMVVS